MVESLSEIKCWYENVDRAVNELERANLMSGEPTPVLNKYWVR